MARCKWNSFNINRSSIRSNAQSVNGPINVGSLADIYIYIYIYIPPHASWPRQVPKKTKRNKIGHMTVMLRI